jgi:hypothetical protein
MIVIAGWRGVDAGVMSSGLCSVSDPRAVHGRNTSPPS